MLLRLLARPRLRLWSTNRAWPVQVIPSVMTITNPHLRHFRDQTSGGTEEYYPRGGLQQAECSVLYQFLHCSTILTKEPGELPPTELISHLPDLTDVVPQPGIPSVTFLLTPSLAHLLNERHNFLHDAISRLLPVADTIKTVAAVVDRLPKEQNSMDEDAGGEGLSVLVTVSDPRSKPAYRRQSAEQAELTRPEEVKQISFFIPGKSNLRQTLAPRHHFQRVVVPLANTVFQNGRQSTLLSSHWLRGNSQEFQRIPSLGIKDSNIFLPSTFNDWRFVSHIPLISVTVPRRITAGFGNIISQVSLNQIQLAGGGETHVPITTIVPASQELESTVQAYFKRQALQPHKVTIWALVTPQEHVSRDWAGHVGANGGDSARDEFWHQSGLGQPIRMKFGDCLHRVLGGGGGWGKKQGLLALDPEISCREGGDRDSWLGTGEGHERRADWGEVARPGDFIQFFIYQPIPKPVSDESDVQFPQNVIAFGSIPSNTEAALDKDFNPSPQCRSQLKVIRNQFGALSALGIVHQRVSFAVSKYDGRASQPRLPDLIEQTKVDVPYSKICFSHKIEPEKPLDIV